MFKIKKKKPKQRVIAQPVNLNLAMTEVSTEVKDVYDKTIEKYWTVHNILYDPSVTLSSEQRSEFEYALKEIERAMRKLEKMSLRLNIAKAHWKK